jgi:hypothetical protein
MKPRFVSREKTWRDFVALLLLLPWVALALLALFFFWVFVAVLNLFSWALND